MTILITGAFGFVGTNLSAYLAEKGHELWALDLLRPQSGRNDECKNGAYSRCFSWKELEKIPWGEVDAVVHLAGKAHDTRNASDPQSYFDINVGLTKRVLEAWKDGISHRGTEITENFSRQDAKTPRRFILFSSVKAVADRVEGVLTEEALPNPKTPYGQSKLEAEGVVRSSLVHYCVSALVEQKTLAETQRAQRGKAIGNNSPNELLYYILRPCMIHGPGNKGNLNLLYGIVSKGVPWPLGAFENRRSFASIGNVCAAVEGLLTGTAPSGVYQVADDEALSINALIGLMAETLGRKARIWRVPAGLIRCAARCGDVLHLPLNSERLKKLTESYVASNAKIKAALGWEKMPIRAEEGMRKTIESFSRQGAKTQSEESGLVGKERIN